MADWEVFVRPDEYPDRRVAQVTQYTRLDVQFRHADVSTWELEIPASSPAAAFLTVPGYGVELVRHGNLMLTGPVRQRHRVWSLDADKLLLEGPDDLVHVQRRVAHPEPGSSAPPYSSTAYDVRTDTAEGAVKTYVYVNAGLGAVTARRVSGLTVVASTGRGATVTGRGRWQNLLTLIQELVAADGFGLTAHRMAFDIVVPATPGIVFTSDNSTLGSYEYSQRAPDVDFVYVGGGGEGTARMVVEGSSSAAITGWGRIEQFRDRRDTTDSGELAQSATETLAEGAADVGLSFTPIDGHGGRSATFGRDYTVGDVVTVRVETTDVTARVMAARIVETADGETIELTVGSTLAGRMVPQMFRNLARLRRDVQNLNAR